MKLLNYVLALILLSGSYAVYSLDLLESQTSWDGGQVSYPKGQAQVTSMKVIINDNDDTKFHCHPVPTFGYILSGTVEVETKDGKKIQFTKGESVVEVMRTVHRGTAIGGPVEIVVFYAGSVDLPNTVMMDDDLSHELCRG